MTRNEIVAELLKLDSEERLQIVEVLWDSIADEDLPLTDEQASELQRRMDELENDPSIGIPWEDVKARLRERFD
jgi:putative addiction module component (TIGR02574 family)